MESNKIFKNSFGSIDGHILAITLKNGVEQIPINKISSVGFRQKRNLLMGLLGTVGGLTLVVYLISQSRVLGSTEILIGLLICLVIFLGGVANLIGHHEIIIASGGNNNITIKVEMSKTNAALDFVNAIRTAIKR